MANLTNLTNKVVQMVDDVHVAPAAIIGVASLAVFPAKLGDFEKTTWESQFSSHQSSHLFGYPRQWPVHVLFYGTIAPSPPRCDLRSFDLKATCAISALLQWRSCNSIALNCSESEKKIIFFDGRKAKLVGPIWKLISCFNHDDIYPSVTIMVFVGGLFTDLVLTTSVVAKVTSSHTTIDCVIRYTTGTIHTLVGGHDKMWWFETLASLTHAFLSFSTGIGR